MTPSSEPPRPLQEEESHRWAAQLRPFRTLNGLLLGLTALSLLVGLLLMFGTTPQQQSSWPVAALMTVTYVATLLGFFMLLMRGIASQRPWWARILSTIGVVGLFLAIGYLTLLEPLVPPSIHRLEPALTSLWIVAFVCLVVGDVVSSRVRRRASR